MPHDIHLDRLIGRIAELRASLQQVDYFALAMKTGARCSPLEDGRGEFRFPLWDRDVLLSCPEFFARDTQNGAELPDFLQALLLYYFTTSDGAPLAGKWISFSELPNGRFYNQAFQGYTGKELARAFGDDLPAFERAALALKGKAEPLADAAFSFQALPRLPLLAVYWRGDEDFPSTCQILFDESASHHLPTDACAILGSTLTRKLLREGTRREANNAKNGQSSQLEVLH